ANPAMSSVEVSRRTRIAGSPRAAISFARSAANETRPQATPGEATTAFAADAAGSAKRDARAAARSTSATRASASLWLMTPSLTKSTAIFRAARGVRLAVRVCRNQSFPQSYAEVVGGVASDSFSGLLAQMIAAEGVA